jgi:hypothetical protein
MHSQLSCAINDWITSGPPRPKAVDKLAGMSVGDVRLMEYSEAQTAIKAARLLDDGRRWSLRPHFQPGDGRYASLYAIRRVQ